MRPIPLKFIASTCMPRTPEEQSDRSPCARRGDCAQASFWRFNGFFLLPSRRFLGQIPLMFCTFAQVF